MCFIVCPDKCLTTTQSGDVWKSEKCQVCSCNRGEVTCYQPSCPLCPEGMVPILNDNTDCCPLCQPITCPSQCSLCVPGNPEPMCTVCQKGFYHESGRCVKECSKGTFQQGAECVSCHPSCSMCSEASSFHCTRYGADVNNQFYMRFEIWICIVS